MGTPDVVDSLSFEIERLRTRVAASRSPEAFSQLGRLLRQRFALTASHEDLDAAVQAFESAIEVTSNSETDVVPHLSNLAAALSDRFVRERRYEDLNRAVEFASSAVERAAVENAEQPEYLANLGAALYTRYEVTGDLRDLDQAIVSSERALRLVDSKNQSAYLTNLSTALQARFSHTHDLATLDRAIQFARLAVEATADTDPARWSRLLTLCVSLSLRALQTRSSDSADQALGVLAVAANESSISDSERLDIADLTATVAASQSRWLTAMQALSQALASTEGVSFERLNAQVATHRARLASDAASCAIHLNDVKRAIELFDAGRARFLTGESAFRANLSTLAPAAPYLVGPLVELHDYLSVAISQDMKSQPEAARRDRAQIRKRWYEEVERVRELPGFDRFLTASDYSLVEMSSSEIVTAVNISRFGSHALLVSRDGVTTVGLPALTVESAAKQAEIYEKVVLVGGNPRDARNRELLLLEYAGLALGRRRSACG